VPALNEDTIVAIATPPGKGGVGIVRLSGPQAKNIAEKITSQNLNARHATFCSFTGSNNNLIDQGIAIFFQQPHSFTGEDVVELQAHGGRIILDQLINESVQHGARIARPGEFSERAFLNDKIDLVQAEAIADMIAANTEMSAKSALESLQGQFSKEINLLIEKLVALRAYVEAALDFPEEEIDFLSDKKIQGDIEALLQQLQTVFHNAKQGTLLNEGITIVIAGKPNAGKSSLLNALAKKDSAIVTDIAGTTRDILRENIQIDGMPLHIIDTAGLRQTDNSVENEGIRRAQQEIENADHVLLVVDSTESFDEKNILQNWPEETIPPPQNIPVTLVVNKADLSGLTCDIQENRVTLAAKQQQGIEFLTEHLKQVAGLDEGQSVFTARRRHLDALKKADLAVQEGLLQISHASAGELLAEELLQAQRHLEEITGRFTPDDLLDKIFRDFCIGK